MTTIKKPSLPAVFNDFFDTRWFDSNLPTNFNKLFPAVNIKKNDKSYHLELVAPGFKKEEIKVGIENDLLVISGETKFEYNEKEEDFTRREFTQSNFKRAFHLPEAVNLDNIDAKFENGILTIEVPYQIKSQEAGKKAIVIK